MISNRGRGLAAGGNHAGTWDQICSPARECSGGAERGEHAATGLRRRVPVQHALHTGRSTVRSARVRAFTLIEVLVALSIFALAAVVLGSAYLNVLTGYEVLSRGMQVNEDFAFARQLVLREPDRQKLEQGGEFETAGGNRAKWSVEITSTSVPNVFNVAFTSEISDSTGTQPTKLAQQFTVLRPTWVIDTAERDKLKADIKTRIYELQGKKPQ